MNGQGAFWRSGRLAGFLYFYVRSATKISCRALVHSTSSDSHISAPVLFSYFVIHRILKRHGIFPHFPEKPSRVSCLHEIRAARGKWNSEKRASKEKMSDVKTARPVWKPAGKVHTG